MSKPALRGIAIVSGVANLPITLMPLSLVFYFESVNTPAWKIGLIGTSFGVGIIAGSFLVGSLIDHLTLGTLGIIAISCFALGQLAIVFTWQNFWPTCIIFALSAIPLPAFNAAIAAFTNVTTPEELLGRTVSATGIPGMVLMPVGSILAGVLFDQWGVLAPLGIAAGTAILAAAIMAFTPALKGMPRITAPPEA